MWVVFTHPTASSTKRAGRGYHNVQTLVWHRKQANETGGLAKALMVTLAVEALVTFSVEALVTFSVEALVTFSVEALVTFSVEAPWAFHSR